MYDILLTILMIISVLIIISVLLQPSKQDSAASAFTGGAGQLFGKQKARGFEAVMQRFTAGLGFLFIVISLVLAYLSSH